MSILEIAVDKIKERITEACEHGEIEGTERVLSVVAGGYILGSSAKRLLKSPLMALSGIIAGGGLIARGVTGKCPFKGILNSTDENEVTVIEHRYFVK